MSKQKAEALKEYIEKKTEETLKQLEKAKLSSFHKEKTIEGLENTLSFFTDTLEVIEDYLKIKT